jgi:hypothetical protein
MALPLGGVAAQTTSSQLWGEVDAYWTPWPSSPLRVLGTLASTRADEANTRDATLGLYVGAVTGWGSFRVGTNITRSLSTEDYREDRVVVEANAPMTTGRWRFRSRTRFEQRWILGAPSQRYRERLRLEREAKFFHNQSLLPYAVYELYYDTRYQALSRTGYRLGVELPLATRLKLDVSTVRQDNRFGSPRHVDAMATTVSLLY